MPELIVPAFFHSVSSMSTIQSIRKTFSRFTGILGSSLTELKRNDPLRMAGATAFFTTFALPPILFIMIQFIGLFLDRRSAGRQLIKAISNTLGENGAGQVRQVLRSIGGFGDSWYIIVGGFIFLLFVATTLFSVIRNSLNQIWQIRVKERPGLLFVAGLRLRSLAVIVLAGLLFIIDMLSESMEIVAGKYVDTVWQGSGVYFKTTLHEITGVIVVAVWFIVLFRFLADGRPSWKAAFIGGLLTAILFTAGKLLLKFLLIDSNIGKLYGASGSIVLVLLFVFYSSFILYYGACFVYIYSLKTNTSIHPIDKAVAYKIEEIVPKEIKL
jgi:membrane protein